jgi:DNA-binding phage protein
MALTRSFKETVKARAAQDPAFRVALLEEALEALVNADLETGKVLLREYVNATLGFEELGARLHKSPKSLMRMLSTEGNPRANNLFAVVAHLKEREGLRFDITLHGRPNPPQGPAAQVDP